MKNADTEQPSLYVKHCLQPFKCIGKMTSFGLRLSEATQLHNGAWVATLLHDPPRGPGP